MTCAMARTRKALLLRLPEQAEALSLPPLSVHTLFVQIQLHEDPRRGLMVDTSGRPRLGPARLWDLL